MSKQKSPASEIKVALFEAQKGVIQVLSEAGPEIPQEGGASVGVLTGKNGGTYRPRWRKVGSETRLQHSLRAGSVPGYREALTRAVGTIFRLSEEGTLKTGNLPTAIRAKAESFLASRWTPELQHAFQFLLSVANAAKKSGPTQPPLGVKVGDEQAVIRVRGVEEQKVRAMIEKGFTCEACGHVNGTLLTEEQTQGLIAQAKAEKAVKTNTAKAAKKAAKKAVPAPKVAAA